MTEVKLLEGLKFFLENYRETEDLMRTRCVTCTGIVQAIAIKGRKTIHHGMYLEIPEDIKIPTCNQCGETYYDEKLSQYVDKRLNKLIEFQGRFENILNE